MATHEKNVPGPGGTPDQGLNHLRGDGKPGPHEYTGSPGERKEELSPLQVALSTYACNSIPIFPCKNCPDDPEQHKRPLTPHGFKDASWNQYNIRQWWQKWPNALIGMPTGPKSGVDVLDLDVKKGKNGFLHVPDWETRTPVISRTGSGGAHLYFKSDGTIRNSTDQIALGVDTRGEGGYVILPPSEGYTWVNGSDLTNLPPWPADLRPRERSPNAKPGLNPEAPLAVVAGCVDVIPNPDIGHDDWNLIGMAIWRATGGADVGADIFDAFSKKSGKYNARTTLKKWNGYFRSPPTQVGFGTLAHHADEAELERKVWSIEGKATYDELPIPVMPEPLTIKMPETANNVVEEAVVLPKSEPKVAIDTPETKATKVEGPPPKMEEPPKAERKGLFLTSRQFVGNFTPPDYLITGLLQRHFLYSLTAPTGHGKTSILMRIFAHVACGIPLGKLHVEQGKVLFLAGENPDDVRMRWIKLAEEMKIDPHHENIFWREGSLKLSDQALRVLIDNETYDHGPFAAVGVDTSVAFFEGDDENDNAQMVAHAKMLRTLCELSGAPTTIVTTHPPKNYDLDNLLPRGGGAFLAEVDGNFVCPKDPATNIASLHWQGKLRGPDFAPVPFKIEAGTTDRLKDSKGNLIWTVAARPITQEEQKAFDDVGRQNQKRLLVVMLKPGLSLAELATACGWFYKTGEPNKSLVQRYLTSMKEDGWAKKNGDHWVLTKAGKEEAEETKKNESQM